MDLRTKPRETITGINKAFPYWYFKFAGFLKSNVKQGAISKIFIGILI